MKTIRLLTVTSTNSWLAAEGDTLGGECLVYAVEQTAGRGQRGNSWEAEPGKNLTGSFLLFPEGIEPASQFFVSEAVALAVTDLLASIGVEAKVKWPNDIYVADRKIAGILIEHSVMGRKICRTIAGVGLNLNQREFRSDAPNPVSVVQLTGEEQDVDEAARLLGERVGERMKQAAADAATLHSDYLRRLWRGDGAFYPFLHVATGARFAGRIVGIDPDGTLHVSDSAGNGYDFLFKEVEFLLEE
ncbi:MAG: biotin--[acetyl-CoA-carboxylase] ligase [Muribaculaceae bacterium]|nr:biotin--[acetyl-CoA-carboxylase] ligase [Muribaculaceae bacterium]